MFHKSVQIIRKEGLKVFIERAVEFCKNTIKEPTFSGWGMTTDYYISPLGLPIRRN